jgi:large subunit ribosomal protein L30e
LDLNKEIRQAVTTGRVILGSDKSLKALKLGNAKLVLLALNCPDAVRGDIEQYAKLAGVPVHFYPGDSLELGHACGKPFLVNVVAVLDPGSSNILNLGAAK